MTTSNIQDGGSTIITSKAIFKYSGIAQFAFITSYVITSDSTRIHTIHLLTEESVTQTDADRLGLSVVGQSILAKLATNTRLLVTTEGHLVVQSVVGVDPDGTGAQGVGDLDGGVEVLGVHGGGETVGGRVADADGLLLGLEFGDGADGAKDLFLHNLHVLGHIGEDRRLDEVTLITLALAASLDGGTGILARLNVPAKDFVRQS